MVDRFYFFKRLRFWQKTLVFLGSLGLFFGIAFLASIFFTWLGLFAFFCVSLWLGFPSFSP